jgi:hypothetical protein
MMKLKKKLKKSKIGYWKEKKKLKKKKWKIK